MHALILGGTPVATTVEGLLSSAGHTVTRIEPVPDGFTVKRGRGGDALTFPGLDLDTMTAAGAASADLLVAAGPDDNLNIVALLMATRVLDLPTAVAVVVDPARAATYSALGMIHLQPETAAGQAVLAQIDGLMASTAAE